MPARGPRSDLCVVVVTTSQYSNGCASSCAATRPLRADRVPCHHPKLAPRTCLRLAVPGGQTQW